MYEPPDSEYKVYYDKGYQHAINGGGFYDNPHTDIFGNEISQEFLAWKSGYEDWYDYDYDERVIEGIERE
jgi:hypothetical protein